VDFLGLSAPIDEGRHVDHPAQLDGLADLAAHQAEALQLDAQHCWWPLNEATLFGRNFDMALFTLVHAVCVLATNALLPEVLLQRLLNCGHLPDVKQEVHEMLERGGDVLAAHAGHVLPHVAAKDLVERGRLFAGVVQGLEGSTLCDQIGPLERFNQVPENII
jgi:hypothetical protein